MGRIRSLVLLGIMVPVIGGPAPRAEDAQPPTRTIALWASPRAVAVDTRTGRVFVVALASPATRTVAEVLTLDARLGTPPRLGPRLAAGTVALAIDAQAGRAFVLDAPDDSRAPSTMSTLDAASGRLLHTVTLQTAPSAIAVDPARGRLFVGGPSTLVTLDSRSGTILRTFSLPHTSGDLVVDQRTGHVVMVTGAGVLIVDARNGTPLRTIRLRREPTALALDLRTAHLFAVQAGDGSATERMGMMSTVDLHRDAVVRTVSVGPGQTTIYPCERGGIKGLVGAGAPTVDGMSGRVFVPNTADGAVRVVDASTGAALRTLVVGNAPAVVAVADRQGRVFVTTRPRRGANCGPAARRMPGLLHVLDASSGVTVRIVAVGHSPLVAAVDETTGHVFVANRDSDSVSVLDVR